MSDFEKAAQQVKKFTKKPTDQQLLQLYGLYKQATIGDCNTDKPGMFAFKQKAKWQAWNKLKGMDKQQAKMQYIALVKQLAKKYK